MYKYRCKYIKLSCAEFCNICKKFTECYAFTVVYHILNMCVQNAIENIDLLKYRNVKLW